MNNEFKKSKNGECTVYTLESATSGGTSTGNGSSVSMPIGGIRRRGDNLIAQEEKKDASKPRNFVAKNAKMGGAGQHKDKKKAEKQGDVKHKKPFAEAAMAAQAAPGAVKKSGTLDLSKKVTPPVAKPAPQAAAQPVTPPPPTAPADMAKLSATVPAYKAPAQPTTPPPPKLGTPPGSTKPADMAKLSATVPAYTPAAKPVTPPPPPYKPGATTPPPPPIAPPKPGAAPASTTTPPPPPSKPAPNAPAPTAPPVPGQAAAAPAKPNLGADFEAGLAAQKAGGSPTAMLLAQPSIGGNQQMLDAIATGFGLPKGSTVDDILAADAARTAGKTPVAEGMDRAVDDKGRTQQEWVRLVKAKFPDAKIRQSKMIDGPCFAMLSNGKKLSWNKVEQDVNMQEMASKLLSAEDRNGVITVIVQAPDGTKRSLADENPRYINQWLMKYDLSLPKSVTSKFVEEDHEIQMASSELQSIAKNSVHLLSLVRKYSENDGLEAWQQSKITKAADYLNSVLQSISGEQDASEAYGRYDRRDAYQRDYDHSVAGMDRGNNHRDDERHDLDPSDWYIVKDGKMFKVSVYPSQEQEAISRGYSRTRDEAKARAGEQGMAEAVEDRTSYQVAKILSDKGIKYDPAHEGDLIKAIGMVLVKELNMSPKEARYLISYDEDFLSDTMSELSNMKNAGGDEYMESLARKLAEKIPANAPVDVWVQDFQKADPNKYHQFKNKTPAKKAQMAVAASYAAKNPSKK